MNQENQMACTDMVGIVHRDFIRRLVADRTRREQQIYIMNSSAPAPNQQPISMAEQGAAG